MAVLGARHGQAALVAERVHVREIDDEEGQRLLRIIRRGAGSVVTRRRAEMVLLPAQGMPVAKIAKVPVQVGRRMSKARPVSPPW